MRSVWLKRGAEKEIRLVPIDLPIYRMASADDMWTSADERPESIRSRAIQCLEPGNNGWPKNDARQLVFVLTGELQLLAHGLALRPGRAIVLEPDIQVDEAISFSSDCRVLTIHVGDWEPRVSKGALNFDTPHQTRRSNFKWLYSGSDGQAYFSDFVELFDEKQGWGSTLKPVYDTMLIEQADGFFMDWHPEGANNLVVVLTGELELETAGGGQHFERFGPGDICFAVDRTGQGHIDRARGPTLLATIVVPTKEFALPPA